jgi:hypothetical protein
MPRKPRFTTSGLKRHGGTIQRKTQPVTHLNFPKFFVFEILYLISNSKYLGLSIQHQDILRKEIERSFFAWMMEKRKDGETTTPFVKETMYKSIAEKHLALIEEDGPGLFGFLTRGSAAPAFQDVDDLCVTVGGREDSSSVVRFCHSGVIPVSPHQIILFFPMPVSRPLGTDIEVSTHCQPELGKMPFSELFDSPVHHSDLPSFPAFSETFPPPLSPIRHFEKDVTMCPMPVIPKESFLEILANADVSETLREISETQAQISLAFNQGLDALLRPCDYTKQM